MSGCFSCEKTGLGMEDGSIKGRLRSTSKPDREGNMATPNSSSQSSQSSQNAKKTVGLKEKLFVELPKREEITVQKIWDVLLQITNVLEEMKEDISAAKGNSFPLESSTQNSLGQRLNSVESLLEKTSTRLDLVGNFVIRQEEKYEALHSEVKSSKRNKMRPNLVVRGLVETLNEDDEDRSKGVASFFKDQMEIEDEIPIKKSQRLGKPGSNKDRPMLIKLKDQQHKSIIFKSVSNLKGKRNVKRRLFNVDDDRDAEQSEPRNYYRDLKRENDALDEDDRIQLKMVKGQIMANNQIIKSEILDPNAARVLSADEAEMESIKATKLIRCEEFSEKGSDYLAYVQRAKSIKEVQKGMYKMRVKFADATHISMGYRLEQPKGPFQQGYFDDQEHGAGRSILQAIKDRAMTSVAVYIVRFFGGTKLGRRRFEITSMLTTAALTTFTHKSLKRRSNRERILSRESLASSIMSMSEDEEGAIEGQTNGTSQEEVFTSATEQEDGKTE